MAIRKNLVLGGAGTVGGALCRYLLEKGEQVISLDIKTSMDIRVDNLYQYADVDYVWFLAWEVGGSKFLTNNKNLLNIMRNNTLICERVFSFLENTKLPFMFASTQLAAPDTAYGVTKLLGEQWTRLLGGQMVKFWNVYGWEEPGEKSHVIPDLILQGLENKHIKLLSNGEEKRQFIFMDDCVENMFHIRNTGVLNVDLTNGEWLEIREVAQLIAQRLGASLTLGEQKGYCNMIEPVAYSELSFNTTLPQGIDILIEKAKNYLQTPQKR
jgi:nucleoside-diphosphate-sugar epimerase